MTVYILRGLPGSGKSTKAKELMNEDHVDVAIVSADYYFHRPDGTYDWNARLIGNAHKWCQEQFIECMEGSLPYGKIIVDNTNIRRKDFQFYVDNATRNGYKVVEIIVGTMTIEAIVQYAQRNIHKVPYDTICRMAERFEP